MTLPALAPPDYAVLPPEINSGRIYAGPGSTSLAASAAAWQALAAQLGSTASAFQAVVNGLAAGAWQGPSSASMAAAAAPYVAWMTATAGQAEQAAASAGQAAMAFETARVGVIPPPVIEANRDTLETLIATNFLGVNTPAIAATEAAYQEFWAQDASVMYAYSADAAALTGSLVPFTPPPPMTDPTGLAGQAAAVAQASGQAAGQVGQQAAMVSQETSALPGGMDAQTMLTMGPQLMSIVPQLLQGLAQPAMQGLSGPLQGVGQFQSLLSPFLSMASNPSLMGGTLGSLGAAEAAPLMTAGGIGGGGFGSLAAGLGGGGIGGIGGAGLGPISAGLGGVGRIGGLSVPASWAAGSQTGANAPVLSAARAAASAAPASAGGSPGVAPMNGMGGARESSGGEGGPRYGTPVRVLPRPR